MRFYSEKQFFFRKKLRFWQLWFRKKNYIYSDLFTLPIVLQMVQQQDFQKGYLPFFSYQILKDSLGQIKQFLRVCLPKTRFLGAPDFRSHRFYSFHTNLSHPGKFQRSERNNLSLKWQKRNDDAHELMYVYIYSYPFFLEFLRDIIFKSLNIPVQENYFI